MLDEDKQQTEVQNVKISLHPIFKLAPQTANRLKTSSALILLSVSTRASAVTSPATSGRQKDNKSAQVAGLQRKEDGIYVQSLALDAVAGWVINGSGTYHHSWKSCSPRIALPNPVRDRSKVSPQRPQKGPLIY